jgi:hypothetical protein
MAVQSDISRISYAGNNSTSTSYAVPFVFLENSHLKAIAKTSAGVETAVTLTNHTGAGDPNGGTVRTAVAVPVASTLTIYREVPATQTTIYQEGGDFPAASHERALDKLTQIAQQNARGLDRTLRFSEAFQLNEVNPPVSATPHVLTTVNGGAPTWETVPSVSTALNIPALTDATTVNAADELIIQQGGITKRATGAELAKGLNEINGTVNVKDFGAVGDGVANDTAAIQAALSLGGSVYIPEGLYIVDGLFVPSNTKVTGAGIDLTIIKLSDTSPYFAHAITNSNNTGSSLTNTGNTNITISDMTVDGNGFRNPPVTSPGGGCAVILANVSHGLLRNIKAIRGYQHCIDISSSNYENIVESDNYIGSSFDITLENCIGVDPRIDDAITTHYSHNINIINPQCYTTGQYPLIWITQGLEIDDGSYDVTVFGGFIRRFAKGLQIKGHPVNTPAYGVRVFGLTVEGCRTNYDISDNNSIFDDGESIVISGCRSLQPENLVTQGTGSVPLEHMRINGYYNVTVRDFHVEGDGVTPVNNGITCANGMRNSVFDSILFKNIVLSSTVSFNGLIRFASTTEDGNILNNISVIDCVANNVIYLSNISRFTEISNIYGKFTLGGTQPALIRLAPAFKNSNNIRIRNVKQESGYAATIVSEDGSEQYAANQEIAFSGTYTPTITNGANVTASSSSVAHFFRVGGVVHVAGKVSVTPTASNQSTVIDMAPPIPSNFSTDSQLGGTASENASSNTARLYSNGSLKTMRMAFRANTSGSSLDFSFVATYRIV